MVDEDDDPLAPLLKCLRLQRADQEAWEALYYRMWGFVVGIAYRVLRGEWAEDTAQEVFFRVSRYCPFEKLQTGDAFRAYLRKVTLNECYSRLRREGRKDFIARVEFPPDVAIEPEREFEWSQIYEWVTDELPPEDRRILELTDQGFSGEEIAKELSMTPNNVAVRRHRARDLVRKFMRNNGLTA